MSDERDAAVHRAATSLQEELERLVAKVIGMVGLFQRVEELEAENTRLRGELQDRDAEWGKLAAENARLGRALYMWNAALAETQENAE